MQDMPHGANGRAAALPPSDWAVRCSQTECTVCTVANDPRTNLGRQTAQKMFDPVGFAEHEWESHEIVCQRVRENPKWFLGP